MPRLINSIHSEQSCMITIWIFTIFILFQTNSLCNLRDCFIDFPWILCLGIYNYTSIFWRFFQIKPTICRITIICTGNCPINFSNNGILYIICFYKYFPILKWGQEINNPIIFSSFTSFSLDDNRNVWLFPFTITSLIFSFFLISSI